VLFHMVTGRPPFEGTDPLAIVAKHLQEDPPAPSAVDPSIPADWDALILKALAKDPAKRYQSAAAFMGAIADLSTGEGPDAAAGARAATRRRKRWLLIGSASAAVLIAGAGALVMHGSTSPQSLTVVGRSVPQWGYAGFISPSLRAPAGIAVDTQGDVYVADTNHDRIVELSPSGLPIRQWGTPGHDVGQVSHPEGVLVDTHGDVYVADTDNYRIQEFSPNGKWLGQWPLSVTANPYLNPEYLAGDGRGAIYVTTVPDAHLASNLIKFAPGGGSQVFGLPARPQTCSYPCVERPLGDPVGVAVDATGAVYVPDAAGDAIRKLSPTGKLLALWNSQLNHPSGIALDPEGHIYIADTGDSRIVKLSATGRLLASWRTAGPGSVSFRTPDALAVDARGNVFVADTGNNRILKLSPEGIVSSQWKTQPPTPIVRLRVPAITVDRHDDVWTVNPDQDRVYELSPSGTRLRTWVLPSRLGLHGAFGLAVDGAGRVSVMALVASGFPVIAQFTSHGAFLSEWGHSGVGPGGLSTPSGLAVDRQGNVYVADTGNYRIQKFSPSGRPLRQWGATGQFEWPVGVALDRHNNIWVVDSASNRVQELSPTGKPLALWGKKGSAPGEFRGPMSIAVDARDHVYVADTGNNRIQELSPTGRPLAVSGSNGLDPGTFLAPSGVSVDPRGDVYVADWHGIHKLEPSR
jgi:DNA-binding beta-propeller fold protein YncE